MSFLIIGSTLIVITVLLGQTIGRALVKYKGDKEKKKRRIIYFIISSLY